MRVFVTGHLGYLGGVLVPMLLDRGHSVVGCDVNYFADCCYIKEDFECVNLAIDVRDLKPEHLDGFDTVIHLAGLSNDPLGNFDPALTDQINQSAAVTLAMYARDAGVARFIFASSCSNYGASDSELLDEQSAFNPQTAYGESKVVAESRINALHTDTFSPVNLRAGTVYGVAPKIRFDLVVNNLMAHAKAGGRILLKSDGQAWRPLVHVSDVARAYVAAAEAPCKRVAGQAFNVGRTEENYQIHTVANMVRTLLPDCQIELTPGASHDTRNYRVNCDKILANLPEFQPRWNLEHGLEELDKALTDCPVSVTDFEGARFNRLLHLQMLIAKERVNTQLRMI